MKMTLSSHTMSNADSRLNSPNTSPKSSPRPSPILQHKLDITSHKSDQPKAAGSMPKTDQSPVSPPIETCAAAFSPQSDAGNKSESTGGSSSGRLKKDARNKKKPPWYVLFYPTYKSRSEDFRHIFKDVPDDERLIVDYSCALQKEILVQGRLYVTQSFLCFYANIFGWETTVTLRWKDVTAMTKEKTALVIPNAVLVSSKSDRYFFTSFIARDKVYLMLFRVWQNALMDRQMNQSEMWQLVHNSYGDELGLTSDDEDYILPGTEDDKMSAKVSIGSNSEDYNSNFETPNDHTHNLDGRNDEDKRSISPSESRCNEEKVKNEMSNKNGRMPIDLSDTSDSDREKERMLDSPRSSLDMYPELFHPSVSQLPDQHPSRSSSDDTISPVCSALHEGRQLMNEVIPIHVDQLFTLLFTNSKFWLDFHASRKTTDLTQSAWTHNAADNTKSRIMCLTVPVGPKNAQATETQVMLPCSKAGHLYSVDSETINAGVPYADSFCILLHYCIHRISENQTNIAVYGQIKYKKSVWGLVKGMIEKNCWSGLEDFFSCLRKALLIEAEEYVTPAVKRRRRRQHASLRVQQSNEVRQARNSSTKTRSMVVQPRARSYFATFLVFSVLILLVILNGFLYYRLWSLEEGAPHTDLNDLQVLKNPPKNHDEWLKLLQKQEALHSFEVQKWQKLLKASISLLRQAETALLELQKSIHPAHAKKIISIISNMKEHNYASATSTNEEL